MAPGLSTQGLHSRTRVPATTPPPPSASLGYGRTSCYRTMDPHRGKTSSLFSRLGNGLRKKRRPITPPLSTSLGPPAPQTSLSTSSRIISFGRMLSVDLTCSISQFSSFRMNSSYPFSLAFPQTRSSPATTRGSAFSTP